MAISQKLMKKISTRKLCEENNADPKHTAVCSHCNDKLQLRKAEVSLQIFDQAIVHLKERDAKWERDFKIWQNSWRAHLSELSFENVLARVYGYDYMISQPEISKRSDKESVQDDSIAVESPLYSSEFDFETETETNSEFDLSLTTPVFPEAADNVEILSYQKCFFE